VAWTVTVAWTVACGREPAPHQPVTPPVSRSGAQWPGHGGAPGATITWHIWMNR